MYISIRRILVSKGYVCSSVLHSITCTCAANSKVTKVKCVCLPLSINKMHIFLSLLSTEPCLILSLIRDLTPPPPHPPPSFSTYLSSLRHISCINPSLDFTCCHSAQKHPKWHKSVSYQSSCSGTVWYHRLNLLLTSWVSVGFFYSFFSLPFVTVWIAS